MLFNANLTFIKNKDSIVILIIAKIIKENPGTLTKKTKIIKFKAINFNIPVVSIMFLFIYTLLKASSNAVIKTRRVVFTPHFLDKFSKKENSLRCFKLNHIGVFTKK